MGCIISKKKRRHHHHHHQQQRKESSEKQSCSSRRIDDSSQSKEEQEDRPSCRDAKVEFGSSRFSEKHPEISEIGDTDEDEDEEDTTPHEELKRDTTSVEAQVAAGWPAWLVSVAGEALVDWAPRRASTFEKLEKVINHVLFFFFSNIYRFK